MSSVVFTDETQSFVVFVESDESVLFTESPETFVVFTEGPQGPAGAVNKYTTTLGDGSATSYVITHGLNSRNVFVTLRKTASPYTQVYASVTPTTVNTVTISFVSAPSLNEFTVTII